MKKKLIIACIISIINPLYSISFQELKVYLSKNSKQLTVKKFDIDISNEDLNIVSSEYYPTISLGYNIEKSKYLANGNTSSTSVGTNNLSTDSLNKSYSYINLDYNLYSFGRLDNKIQNQQYLTDVSKYKYCVEKKNLVLQLLEKYNDILNNQIKRKYLTSIIEEKNTVYSYKEKLFASGDVPHSDVIKSGIEVATLYSQISDNQKEFQTLLNQISFLSNYSLKDNEDFLPLSKSNINTITNFEKTVNAKTIESEMKAKKAEISLYEKDFLPNLSFYSKYDVYGYDDESYKKSIDDMRENSYKFGLNLTLNIFNGFKTSSQKQKAILQLKQLENKYELEKDKFNNELLTVNQNYELDTLNLKNKSKNLELAILNNSDIVRLNEIGEVDKIEKLNTIIEKIYKQMDYQLSKGKVAYEYTKKTILLQEDKCIVH